MDVFSRRAFLATSGAAALALCAGCSSDSPIKGAQVLGRWNNEVLTPGGLRLPVSFGKDKNIMTTGPATVSGRILDLKDKVVVPTMTASMHKTGVPNAYWLFETQLTTPGLYRLVVDGAAPEGVALQVNEDATVTIPKVGQPLPPFDTPTTADPKGVNPICTRTPACPLHTQTLTQALQAGKPVAYLIGTPAHCQTGFCGPILDLLLKVRDTVGDKVTFVHAEVYTDDTTQTSTDAVEAYHLDYEPVLFVTDASGKIVHRLDAVFDQSEMASAIATVA